MHNKDVIFDVENSRIGIVESDCSKGTSAIGDSTTANEDVKIVKNYIIKRPLLIHKDWFSPSKLETTSSIKENATEKSSLFLLPNIDKLKCYIADKTKEIKSYELIIIVAGSILCIITLFFIIGSIFFRLKKNFLIFEYYNTSRVSTPSQVSNNELELSQNNI